MHIKRWATKLGLPGLSHHAIRRTGMELSDEAELLALSAASAEKLRTTTDNKRRHYLQRKATRRHYLLADALYNNFCLALSQHPELTARLGAELPDKPEEDDAIVAQFSALPAERQAKLLTMLSSTVSWSDRSVG